MKKKPFLFLMLLEHANGTIRDFAVGESALMGDYESRFSVLRSVPSTVEEYKALMLKGKKKVKAGQSNCVSVVAC